MKTNLEKYGFKGTCGEWEKSECVGVNKGIVFNAKRFPANLLSIDHEGYAIFAQEADRDLCLSAPQLAQALIDLLNANIIDVDGEGLVSLNDCSEQAGLDAMPDEVKQAREALTNAGLEVE